MLSEAIVDLTPLPTSCPQHGLEYTGRGLESLHLQLCDFALRITAFKLEHTGQGLGRRIVQVLIDFCHDYDRIPIVVDVEEDLLTGATTFWETMGFVFEPNNPDNMIHQGWLPRYCMEFG